MKRYVKTKEYEKCWFCLDEIVFNGVLVVKRTIRTF